VKKSAVLLFGAFVSRLVNLEGGSHCLDVISLGYKFFFATFFGELFDTIGCF
jgi:hypothetical protein